MYGRLYGRPRDDRGLRAVHVAAVEVGAGAALVIVAVATVAATTGPEEAGAGGSEGG